MILAKQRHFTPKRKRAGEGRALEALALYLHTPCTFCCVPAAPNGCGDQHVSPPQKSTISGWLYQHLCAPVLPRAGTFTLTYCFSGNVPVYLHQQWQNASDAMSHSHTVRMLADVDPAVAETAGVADMDDEYSGTPLDVMVGGQCPSPWGGPLISAPLLECSCCETSLRCSHVGG